MNVNDMRMNLGKYSKTILEAWNILTEMKVKCKRFTPGYVHETLTRFLKYTGVKCCNSYRYVFSKLKFLK